ncbi:MAG: hypothetical protein ACWA5L_09950 [bacterium]
MTHDNDLEHLERELPALSRIRRFADNLEAINWFHRLGEAASSTESKLAQIYLDRLGFPDAELAILVDWEEAAGAAETMDWSNAAWEAEELSRSDLTIRAMDIVSQEALQLALTVVSERAGQFTKEAAIEQASLWDIAEEPLYNIAVGSAVQASCGAALALLAAEADPEFAADQHLFAAKFALFEAGRWPLGVIGQSFNMF